MVTLSQKDCSMRDQELLWKVRVAMIAKPGGPNTGLGRYMQILHKGLLADGVSAVRVAPAVPPFPNTWYSLLFRLSIDLRTFLTNYPVWVKYPRADIYHLASQNLASLLIFHRPKGKVIVTVHDIFPYMLRNEPHLNTYRSLADRWFDRIAMKGLRWADRLIATSQYTKQCIVKHLGISPDKIQVVYTGINHDHFQPLAVPSDVYDRYGLARNRHYLIFVGSEDPRKNLATLVHALAKIRRKEPDVELIKVGHAHFDRERYRLIELATQLGVQTAMHFLDDVSEDDLPFLYNLADICVMPSLYEGFGFPVLEAMACGRPVVAARSASLPELVDGAGYLFNPRDPDELAAKIQMLLLNTNRRDLALASTNQARRFQVSQQIADTTSVYMQLYDSNENRFI